MGFVPKFVLKKVEDGGQNLRKAQRCENKYNDVVDVVVIQSLVLKED